MIYVAFELESFIIVTERRRVDFTGSSNLPKRTMMVHVSCLSTQQMPSNSGSI